MLKARTVSVGIARDWREVYDGIWQPQSFTKWASGLSESGLTRGDAGWWKAKGPEGPIRIRFTDHNGFGVMDHIVRTETGAEIYVPMRVVANAGGAEVLLTLFQQQGMTEKQFEADAEWVERDLEALKRLLESW